MSRLLVDHGGAVLVRDLVDELMSQFADQEPKRSAVDGWVRLSNNVTWLTQATNTDYTPGKSKNAPGAFREEISVRPRGWT